MKLVFYGRDAHPAVPVSSPHLSIDRKGVFSFTNGAVAALGLTPASLLVLAQDAETNTWYCVPGEVPGVEAFTLKPRDKSGSKALVFHSQVQGRAYWQAHGLNGQKSVRALVAATPVEADGLKLYPLAPQHPTLTPPAPVASEVPAVVVADAPAASVEVAAPIEELPAPVLEVVSEEAAPVASAPVVPANETAEERMERLTDYWYERSIKDCPDEELNDLATMLAAKRWKDRDIVENTMLNRCKTERVRRDKEKGAGRG